MSSNDFDGSHFGPASGQGADEQGAQSLGAAGQDAGGNGQGAGGDAKYPEPEGWGDDGVWRDSAIDSNYETGVLGAVRPADDGPHEDPGYSYFSDGKGWENALGANGRPGQAPDAGAPGAVAPGAGAAGVTAAGATAIGAYGPGGGPTAAYGGGPGGYVAPMGPGPVGPSGPVGPGGYGPVGPGGPGWPGGPGGPGGPVRPGGPTGPGGPPRPRGRNGKRKGSWWRHWSWKKALAVTGGVFVFFALALFGVYQYLSSSATIPTALASASYQDTTVYYSDGKTVIGTIGATNRQDLTYQQIPKQLQNTVIAAEDKNFWTEGGISPTGILRAAIHDVTSGGGDLNGGSTITQEFVRGYYDGVGTQQTASRKIKEIFIAQKLSASKSKQWILTNYLNLIYLGENSYGVAAAAETYFGEPASQLTVAQDAVIAGIIQQPSTYPLLANRAALTARWQYVLQQMVADKYITQAQMSTMKFPKLLTDNGSTGSTSTSFYANNSDPWAPYIMDVVYNELTAKGAGADNVPVSQVETGGLKVVTTISRPMEAEMYKAVNENIAAIKATPGAEFPSYIRIGAELQNPGNGEILAMYPGPGQNMSAKECAEWDCDLNTAVYAREQVGSSFKPYVLSAAVADGMNVKTSTLNANTYLCVPPDGLSTTLSKQMKYYSTSLCSENGLSGYFPVENDGGEVIGNPKAGGGTTVQNALAQSSNTAFTDLTHRVTTSNVIKMAQAYGVDIDAFPNGSNLDQMVGDTGLALGTASLTVNEQTTMLSAIANNGAYHQSHIVKYWQQPNGPEQMAKVASSDVLDPSNPATNAQLDSQVQYAMEMTTVDGTGTSAAYGLGNRQIIAKTGTTTNSHSGFFIGAIPQYSLVVGMFTQSQASNSTESLVPLTGGGFGGYWPAKIWNTFAMAEFANLPTENFQNPVFTGSVWNQVPKVAKPSVNCTINGKKVKVNAKTCPTPTTTPTCTSDQNGNVQCSNGATCSYDQNGNLTCDNGMTCSYDQNGNLTCDNGATANANATATPTATATCQYQGDPTCNGSNNGSGYTSGATATSTAQGGLAVGELILPGSLLWTAMSRRRRRKRRADTAK